MKVLIVTGIFPPDIGGPATYVPAIGRELVGRGHQVVVLTLSDVVNHDDRAYNFPVVRLRRGVFKPLRFILTALSILRWGRKVDLLFVNGSYPEAICANFFLHKPFVQKIVGDWAWERVTTKKWVTDNFEEFQKTKYTPKIQALKALRTLCARCADKIIVPSRYLAGHVTSWGTSKEKLVVIYNALEPLNCFPPAAMRLSTPLKVVTVGRLIPLKRIEQLIEAVARCDAAGLVIIGDGPERGYLEKLVRAGGLADRIYFAGARSRGETLALMAICDLFALNSTHESFPHVVLEAMSCGLPVVATAVGGTPELVKDGYNGRLVPPSEDGALYRILSHLLSMPSERRRLAEGAWKTIERFSFSQMVEETEVVLEMALRGRISYTAGRAEP